jgi:hypothetical protein
MKHFLLALLLFNGSLFLTAQELVSLRSVPFKTAYTGNIHIHSVVDQREVKNLGTYKNPISGQVELQLQGGAEKSVKDFYALSFKKDSLSKPIYIAINALSVQESKRKVNDGIAEVARAHVSLTFFEKTDSILKQVYSIKHNEDEVFALFDKASVHATHEKRIRAALEYCMHTFLNRYQTVELSVNKANFKAYQENKEMHEQLGEWFNLVTLKGMQSRYFQGYGISYTGFVDSKKGWIRPYETSFEVTWARPDIATSNGFSNVNSFVFRPELYFFYKRLSKGIYASMSANVPVGFETLEDLTGDNSINFVIGVGASQGLRFIPWKKKGLVFGVDFFQQFETSEVYRFDLGLELVLGVNF